MLEVGQRWIDQQRVEWLLRRSRQMVRSKRAGEMAKEANCIDFYNYIYTPFSACVHSMWHHVARYNLGTNAATRSTGTTADR